jgi:hypothetical protein
MTRHGRLATAAGCALVGALALAGCGPNEQRGPVTLTTATLEAPARLRIEVPSCNGNPEVTDLDQADDAVTVEVTTTTRREGDDCLDAVTIDLDEPLGDRHLIDGKSGDELAVART